MFTDLQVSRWQHITAAGGGGYTFTARVKVFRPDGSVLTQQVPASEISWSWDGTSTLPASGQVSVPAIDWSDPGEPVDWRPDDTLSPLAPFGNGITIDIGVDDGVNTPQWMRLGCGLISEVNYNRPAETLDVQIVDLGTVFVQALTTVDWSVTAVVRVSDLVNLILDAAYLPVRPTIRDQIGVLNIDFTQVVSWTPGTPLWEILQTVVSASDPKVRAWFDRDGALVFSELDVDTATPPFTTTPTRGLATGDGGHITELQTSLSRVDAVNIVAVAVEDSEVVDPTYVTITGTESDMAEKLREDMETVAAGTGTGFAKKITLPGGRRGAFTNKQPTPARWPFMDAGAHPIGAVFGQKGSIWWNGTHYGTDFSAPGGGQVVAVCQGRIVHVGPGPEGWAGTYVVQQASDGTRYYYCHLASTAVQKGDFVLRQTPIGQAGDTGKAFGVHLHLERRKPPYNILNAVDWRRGGDVK